MLRNTYINAQHASLVNYSDDPAEAKPEVIRWQETAPGDTCKNPREKSWVLIKSCLKGADKSWNRVDPAVHAVLAAVRTNPRALGPVGKLPSSKKLRSGRENAKELVPVRPVNTTPEVRRKPIPRSKPVTSGVRPPSPLIKNNKPVQRRPSWR